MLAGLVVGIVTGERGGRSSRVVGARVGCRRRDHRGDRHAPADARRRRAGRVRAARHRGHAARAARARSLAAVGADPRPRRRGRARHPHRRSRRHPVQFERARPRRPADDGRSRDDCRRKASAVRPRVGRRRAPAPAVERGRGGHAPGLARTAHRLRRTLEVAARGRHAARDRVARRPPCPRAARPARQHRETRGAPWLRLTRARRPRAARRLPPRRHPRGPRLGHRAVPGRGPLSSGRGVRRERGVRPRAVRAAAAPARALRPARGRPRRAGAVRHHDPVGAVGAPRHRDDVDRAARRLSRSSHRRAPGPRVGRDRVARRRPVPPALGRLPALLRRQPRHRGAGAADHRAAPRSRSGCARCSASPPPRRSASPRC